MSLGQDDGSATTPGGDAAAELYARYAKDLYGFCLARLGSPDEAEEAVQTTFVKALAALNRGQTPDREAAWLYTIALNVCRTQYRSRKRRSQSEVTVDMSTLQPADSTAPPDPEAAMLLPALEALPARSRDALVLREWQGLSYREIAQRLDTSEAAVETLLFRARRSLARTMRAGEHGPTRKRITSLLPWLAQLRSVAGPAGEAKVAVCAAAVGIVTLAGPSAIPQPRAASHPVAAPVAPKTVVRGTPVAARAVVERAQPAHARRDAAPARRLAVRPKPRTHLRPTASARVAAVARAPAHNPSAPAPAAPAKAPASAPKPEPSAPAQSAPPASDSTPATQPAAAPEAPHTRPPSDPTPPPPPSSPPVGDQVADDQPPDNGNGCGNGGDGTANGCDNGNGGENGNGNGNENGNGNGNGNGAVDGNGGGNGNGNVNGGVSGNGGGKGDGNGGGHGHEIPRP